jgi:lipoic acid synthetase
LPGWLDKNLSWEDTVEVKQLLRRGGVRTICEDARCPNISECFKRRTATFLLLGGQCTRGCAFCNVSRGEPAEVDATEGDQIAETARALGLKFVVLTSVTRDDLPDGGSGHFAGAVRTLKGKIQSLRVEVLTPDFKGEEDHIRTVMEAAPDVFAHNVETVRSLTPKVRSKASYDRSLKVLRKAGEMSRGTLIKSGIMVGLGETADEVKQTLGDLKDAGCHAVTIGQYLQPNRTCMQVRRYVEPAVFEGYKKTAQAMGFQKVFAGPYVRSSYLADELFSE